MLTVGVEANFDSTNPREQPGKSSCMIETPKAQDLGLVW